jgi:hypothetical protein
MQYRVYQIKNFQKVAGPTLIEAADDSAAIGVAEQFLSGNELQIWQDSRLVITLKTDVDAAKAAVSDP